jgi:hypothetical protein
MSQSGSAHYLYTNDWYYEMVHINYDWLCWFFSYGLPGLLFGA